MDPAAGGEEDYLNCAVELDRLVDDLLPSTARLATPVLMGRAIPVVMASPRQRVASSRRCRIQRPRLVPAPEGEHVSRVLLAGRECEPGGSELCRYW